MLGEKGIIRGANFVTTIDSCYVNNVIKGVDDNE